MTLSVLKLVWRCPLSRLTKEGSLEACGRKWRSTGRLTLGGSKATKEQRSGFEVVHNGFTEGGDSVVGVFCLELLRAKLPRE